MTAARRPVATEELEIHQHSPHPARMYDYVLGGTTHFAVDRQLAEDMSVVLPGGIDFARALARRNRAFMTRVVRFLTAAGVRQFLDIGAGIPAYDNTHDIAQAADPDSRVVYVDNDPVVLAHAHERLAPDGRCDYVHSDISDVDGILSAAAGTLDLTRPTGLLLIAVLHLVGDGQNPHRIVTRLMDALPPGSFIALSHFTADIVGEEMAKMTRIYNAAGETMVMRSRAEVATFLDGLETVEPGVTLIEDWRPDDAANPALPLYGAVARKPQPL